MNADQSNGQSVTEPLPPAADIKSASGVINNGPFSYYGQRVFVPAEEAAQVRNDKIALYKKLHAVMNDVDYIQKDKKNDFHKYAYASEATIKKHMQDAFVKHGIVFRVDQIGITERSAGKPEKNEILTTVEILVTFGDPDTGFDLSVRAFGTGCDPLDKGLYKAITGAIKYALSSTFLFATGDDPEVEPALAPAPKPAPKATAPAAPRTVPVASAPGGAAPVKGQGPVIVLDEGSAASSLVKCASCGKGVGDATVNGEVKTTTFLLENSNKKYGRDLCICCQMQAAEEKKAQAGRTVNSTTSIQ